MNAIEVMAHPLTARETLRQATQFIIETGMVPLITAALTLVTNGVSTPEDVDRTYLKDNAGAAMGPMALIDMVGMKTFFDVLTYCHLTKGLPQAPAV